MGIQRWTPPGSEIDLAENGDFVLFTDHERVVGELENSIKGYRQGADAEAAEVDRRGKEINELRTALAASRAEVEGFDFEAIRTLVKAVEDEFCSPETEEMEPDESKVSFPEEVCPITFGMIRAARRAIDAAKKNRISDTNIKRDAERYRWLKEGHGNDGLRVYNIHSQFSYLFDSADEVIDAAMEKGNV